LWPSSPARIKTKIKPIIEAKTGSIDSVKKKAKIFFRRIWWVFLLLLECYHHFHFTITFGIGLNHGLISAVKEETLQRLWLMLLISWSSFSSFHFSQSLLFIGLLLFTSGPFLHLGSSLTSGNFLFHFFYFLVSGFCLNLWIL